MIAYLGPPPRDILEKSEYATKYFDSSSKLTRFSSLSQSVFLTR